MKLHLALWVLTAAFSTAGQAQSPTAGGPTPSSILAASMSTWKSASWAITSTGSGGELPASLHCASLALGHRGSSW